ncbi:DUF3130 domain-containing protein [Listeria seeligeri]|uniref:DUF3130 domain-containing protein n=1 Tax=Listeria seeligeri TaxID=1640 RepID=UPI001624CD80|nr:DUF3130 domain-containing protein [Listeria seeligeri]MBC2071383.1 DUF3130 family protein [Listeria seeligeri]MBC2087304.1 DUF3130 family protein [Listeria seeligeri]MBC2213342.1 DUF3130 family protein [Listeria seeligeri]MBF2354801.1 DUF3130 domain-containing protein [Listeria seeligeri]MBF2591484.1 DUF3130 domain-containing protein [Listeria seeligeri]
MSEIKVREASLQKYATKLGDKGSAVAYLPMKAGNMAYSQANSINHFRTAMFDLVEAVDAFQGVVETDAVRLKELGLSFTSKDRELERTMGLEVK